MAFNVKKFGTDQQSKILKRYYKYYNKEYNEWRIPGHEMKNIISECWDLSHALNKYKKLDMDNILDNVKFKTLLNIKNIYNNLSSKEFYKHLITELRKLKE